MRHGRQIIFALLDLVVSPSGKFLMAIFSIGIVLAWKGLPPLAMFKSQPGQSQPGQSQSGHLGQGHSGWTAAQVMDEAICVPIHGPFGVWPLVVADIPPALVPLVNAGVLVSRKLGRGSLLTPSPIADVRPTRICARGVAMISSDGSVIWASALGEGRANPPIMPPAPEDRVQGDPPPQPAAPNGGDCVSEGASLFCPVDIGGRVMGLHLAGSQAAGSQAAGSQAAGSQAAGSQAVGGDSSGDDIEAAAALLSRLEGSGLAEHGPMEPPSPGPRQ